MIRSLHISNYAIIDELSIRFHSGLTTITGETGAGKSILLGALSLLLGQRADTSVLHDKSRKCIVEGAFGQDSHDIQAILDRNDLDQEKQLIIRREISNNGKSRAFVNDTPVTLQVLKELGEALVDIHSQHENLNLSNQFYQVSVVDAYAGTTLMREEYSRVFREYQQLLREIGELEEGKSERLKEKDYLEFQLSELENARLREGELEELEEELEVLEHAREIKERLYEAWLNMEGNEMNALKLLREARSGISSIQKYHKASTEFESRLNSVLIELKDLAAGIEQSGEAIEHDPSRLEMVKERADLLNKLLSKHDKTSVEELLEVKREIDNRILSLDTADTGLEQKKEESQRKFAEITLLAGSLSEKRQEVFPSMEEKISSLLQQLGMPNALFNVDNQKTDIPGENGTDRISFLFTANKKSEPKEISKIASGGELSRIMLAIKYLISGSLGLPTIIFDEIDTGVSGEIAHKVATIMKEMSKNHQICSITHLPQVAARGDQHFLVYKTDDKEATHTRMKLLNEEERLAELAKMLSGKALTPAAYENARVLLMGN